MSKLTNDGLTHRMLYNCAHMATVGVKGLKIENGRSFKFSNVLCISLPPAAPFEK